ncbi:MAG TPA: hypothetical protein VHC19_22880 [Pirellulales bacterium]|nr:hypothetical protein [Pirellulales bacterium]
MYTTPQSVVGRRHPCRRFVILTLALALPLAACSHARAQQPDGDYEGEHTYKQPDGKVVPITESKPARSKIASVLRAGKATTAEEEKHFTDHFRYHLAAMTWKENVTSLPDMRKKMKNYLGQAGRGAAPDLHDRLNKWILEDFEKVAKDARYPRAIRLNCVLMIGDLDQREAAIGGPAEVPLPVAEPVLFGLFNDENQHAALRIEALRGLMRHAEHTLTPDQRNELLAAAVKLIKAPQPPAGKSAVGHMWMRMLSCATVSILAGKGAEANQPAVVDALQALIADKTAPLWLRCYSANTFGSLQAKAFGENKVLPLAQQLAGLVVEVAQTNDRLMEEAGVDANKKKAKAPPKPPVPGESEEEDAEADRPAIPESLLKVAADDVAADLIYVYYGLTGADLNDRDAKPSQTHSLFGAAGQDAKPFVNDLVARIEGMLSKLKDPKKELHEQLADISTDGGELQAWLKQQGASVEPKPETVVKPSDAKPATRPAPGAAVGQPAGNASATESAVNR